MTEGAKRVADTRLDKTGLTNAGDRCILNATIEYAV